jgi:hypothetical protein
MIASIIALIKFDVLFHVANIKKPSQKWDGFKINKGDLKHFNFF